MTKAKARSDVESLLDSREVVVACGPGGVGKTTSAAALAASIAQRRRAKVLVLTVDPARRLADALGIAGLGNTASKIPADAFAAAGAPAKGELWAAMIDTKQSWDALVRRHAPDRSTADQILANPIYQNISGRFAQSHEYIAMERLYEIHSEGGYDLVIVDTPPTRDALDFLDAPQRMADFFASGLLRWLIAPSRSKFVGIASKPFYQVADRILGTQFLGDIAELFLLFQTMYDGFVTRAQSVSALLRDARTTFVIVTTLEPVPALEASRFADALAERHLDLGLVVANKVLPKSFVDPETAHVAELIEQRAGELGRALTGEAGGVGGAGEAGDADQVARVLHEVGRSFVNFERVARRETELLATMTRRGAAAATVPHLSGDVTDVAGLLEIGRYLLDGPH